MQPTGRQMNDVERLDKLRAQLRRLCGNKDWTAKREQSALELVAEIVAIEGPPRLDEIFQVRTNPL